VRRVFLNGLSILFIADSPSANLEQHILLLITQQKHGKLIHAI